MFQVINNLKIIYKMFILESEYLKTGI